MYYWPSIRFYKRLRMIVNSTDVIQPQTKLHLNQDNWSDLKSSIEMNIYGDRVPEVPAHLNFGRFILDKLRQVEDENRACLIEGETKDTLTFKELLQYAVNLATGLRTLGVGKGDVVALGSGNSLHVLPTAFAVIFTGATFVFYDLEYGKAIIKHKTKVDQPKYVITSKLFWERYKDVLTSNPLMKTVISAEEIPDIPLSLASLMMSNEDVTAFEAADVLGQVDTAWIFHSSGTTGMPKAVPYTHLMCILICSRQGYFDKEVQVAWSAGKWAFSYCIFTVFKFIMEGETVVFNYDISPKNILTSIQDNKVSALFVSPSRLKEIAHVIQNNTYNLDSVKYIYSGSTALSKQSYEEFMKWFPKTKMIFNGYGLTELSEVTLYIWDTKGTKLGSIGMASPGKIIKVVDINTRQRLGHNQIGELCVKDIVYRKGYLNIDKSEYLDEEGFFLTGDLGYYDKDKYFYLTERITEMMKVGGFTVSPQALETVLLEIPEVLDAAVVGRPDPVLGDAPAAFVVTRPGSTITEEDIIAYVDDQVTSCYKMRLEGGVIFTTHIPRSDRGKILRTQLKALFP